MAEGSSMRNVAGPHPRDTSRASARRLARRGGRGRGRGRSFHQLRELRLDRLSPDVVALGQWVQVVRSERLGQEHALLIQELRADVEVEDVFLIVELGDGAIDL